MLRGVKMGRLTTILAFKYVFVINGFEKFIIIERSEEMMNPNANKFVVLPISLFSIGSW